MLSECLRNASRNIAKGFSMFVYDFKMPDLSVIAYNSCLKNKGGPQRKLK